MNWKTNLFNALPAMSVSIKLANDIDMFPKTLKSFTRIGVIISFDLCASKHKEGPHVYSRIDHSYCVCVCQWVLTFPFCVAKIQSHPQVYPTFPCVYL